jgi:glycosyltransferase involved in cell wall biosynthesis
VRLNCRGSIPEAAAYGASLALWQRRLIEQADVVIVPSAFARERLRELGAPLPWDRLHVLAPPVRIPRADDAISEPALPDSWSGRYALVASRLAPEKGVDVAIDACRAAGVPLVIAGDGPEREALTARAEGADVRFLGLVDGAALAGLRGGAAIAIVPSRSAETFGLAAAEAMAAGLPVAASSIGALPELLGEDGLVAPGDAGALAGAIERLAGDRVAGELGRERVRKLCAPQVVAAALRELYDGSRPAWGGMSGRRPSISCPRVRACEHTAGRRGAAASAGHGADRAGRLLSIGAAAREGLRGDRRGEGGKRTVAGLLGAPAGAGAGSGG